MEIKHLCKLCLHDILTLAQLHHITHVVFAFFLAIPVEYSLHLVGIIWDRAFLDVVRGSGLGLPWNLSNANISVVFHEFPVYFTAHILADLLRLEWTYLALGILSKVLSEGGTLLVIVREISEPLAKGLVSPLCLVSQLYLDQVEVAAHADVAVVDAL
jgi:hypothetical protein